MNPTERPILFKSEMVRAILDGSKTQTRRVCRQQPYPNGYRFDGRAIFCHNNFLPPSAMLMNVRRGNDRYSVSNVGGWEHECPYGLVGDRLWVREGWRVGKPSDSRSPSEVVSLIGTHRHVGGPPEGIGVTVLYEAGGWKSVGPPGRVEPVYRGDEAMPDWAGKRRPSIHMPRRFSRILLEVADVRIEPLQEISEVDARAEGIPDAQIYEALKAAREAGLQPVDARGPRPGAAAYRDLWSSINGAESWAANPYVWVVTFRRID